MLKLVKIACLISVVGSLYASPVTIYSLDTCGTNTSRTSNEYGVNPISQKSCSDTSTISGTYIDTSLPDKGVLQSAVENGDNSYHLFSHGKPGELFINGKWLQKEAIALFVNSNFSKHTVHGSQLNIYGCNFAQGEKGKAAITYLEKELGISIAASTNITGAEGDWKLEVGNKNLEISDYTHSLQLDTVHYLPPFVGAEYATPGNWGYEGVVLATPSTTSISVTVTDGGGTAIAGSPFSIVKGSPFTIDLGSTLSEHPPKK
jgi:hypothetical protein